ncbi:MAG TPA: hypothetical protein VIK89_11060 [Cytophagaceae bacterium]
MATKSFQEVFDEIKGKISVSNRGGKPKLVKSWSRSDFDRLAKALVNDVDYTIDAVSIKNGEVQKKEIKPVQLYRNTIRAILQDFGVDKQEAARIMDSSYEIRSVDGLYELASELIYKYMEAGKKFDFITREDFMGSLTLREVDESVSEHKSISKDGEPSKTFKVKKGKHKQLEKKSKAPRWLKTRLQ